MSDAHDEGELEAFAERWQLEPESIEMLRAVDGLTRSTVLRDFAPRGNTDVGKKLSGFMRSVEKRNNALQNLSPDAEAFIAKWSLDESGAAWLASLAPEVSEVVVRKFDPSEDVQNIMGKLRAFARSVEARTPTGLPQVPQDQLDDFASRWGLDDNALATFSSFPAEVQLKVMEKFDPKGETVNVNGKVISFAKSIMARHGYSDSTRHSGYSDSHGSRRNYRVDPADAFAERWQLDREMRRFIWDLPEDVRHQVITKFAPAEDTRNVAGKLRSFASGLLARGRGKGERRERGDAQVHDGADRIGAESANPEISVFSARWGLDGSDVEFLEALPDDALANVIEQFAPRAGTRNISAKLHAFAKSFVEGKGRGKGSDPVEPKADDETNDFLERWGLLEDRKAVDCMNRLPHAVRQQVMTEFAPGSETRDVGGKLVGFANSLARAGSSRRAPWQSSAPPIQPRQSIQQAVRVAPLYPSRQPAAASRHSGSDPDEFADRWRLDVGARAMLKGLEPRAQAAVMAEWAPRDDVRDPSGKFCSFARSVAARYTSGQAPTPARGPVGGGPIGGGPVGGGGSWGSGSKWEGGGSSGGSYGGGGAPYNAFKRGPPSGSYGDPPPSRRPRYS